jgi:hypothetical protein
MLGVIFLTLFICQSQDKIKGKDYMDLTTKGLDNEKYIIV